MSKQEYRRGVPNVLETPRRHRFFQPGIHFFYFLFFVLCVFVCVCLFFVFYICCFVCVCVEVCMCMCMCMCMCIWMCESVCLYTHTHSPSPPLSLSLSHTHTHTHAQVLAPNGKSIGDCCLKAFVRSCMETRASKPLRELTEHPKIQERLPGFRVSEAFFNFLIFNFLPRVDRTLQNTGAPTWLQVFCF
jgi:hypothetical protein